MIYFCPTQYRIISGTSIKIPQVLIIAALYMVLAADVLSARDVGIFTISGIRVGPDVVKNVVV